MTTFEETIIVTLIDVPLVVVDETTAFLFIEIKVEFVEVMLISEITTLLLVIVPLAILFDL